MSSLPTSSRMGIFLLSLKQVPINTHTHTHTSVEDMSVDNCVCYYSNTLIKNVYFDLDHNQFKVELMG